MGGIIGDHTVNHFWWADNLCLLATSKALLTRKILDVIAALVEHGIYWKPSSAEILVSPNVPNK